MGGGLLQLVAYGAQDVYLSGNPQITFFKVAYRRHTNFSMESIEQTFNGNADFGRRVTCQISRNGDLIHRMYLQVYLPQAVFAAYSKAGLALVKSVELEIGGQRIDKQYGDWMYIWNELSLPTGKSAGYKSMIAANTTSSATAAADTTLYVPLEFWFCRNPGLALPLIALQYHEVKVNIEFDTMANAGITSVTSSTMGTTALWVDYVFLDTDERRRFAQLSHEYLIEQLQFTGEENIGAASNKVKLNFNHPVKELVWVMQNAPGASGTSDEFGDYTDSNVNYTIDAKLQLNGHDRFATRQGKYFNEVQPFQHHTNVPDNKGINVYSFALKPEEHQPSGTLNFSRIDSAVLNVTASANAKRIRVYAVNYNVLRVMSGMGGLAYSN
jgi:hypothetical protein